MAEPIYQCKSCGKYCDGKGSWLTVPNAAEMRRLVNADNVVELDCLLCRNGYARQAVVGSQASRKTVESAESLLKKAKAEAEQMFQEEVERGRQSTPPGDR